MNEEYSYLREESVSSLQKENITSFTDIQRVVIPHALNQEDILGQAATSSGKTLTYLLPILERLEPQGKGKHFPQALILCPTRELCLQVTDVTRKMLANREGIRVGLLCGGKDIKLQIRAFSKGTDIVIGTPSRVLDHLRRHTFKTKQCHTLVLDEADEMLSRGFEEDVLTVISALEEHQTMLFSATYTEETETFAKKILKDPFIVHIKEEHLLKQDIKYQEIFIQENEKLDLLMELLQKHPKCILFANTIKTCDFLASQLKQKGFDAKAIHSDMDYPVRKKIMKDFREQHLDILIATDVAARGIDIPAVSCVILYDLPDTEESLIHRTGRTARAGNTGSAYLFVKKNEKDRYDLKGLFPEIHTNTYKKKR